MKLWTTEEFIKEYGQMAYEIACNDCEDPTEDFNYLSCVFDEFIEECGEEAYLHVYVRSTAENFQNNLDEYFWAATADPEQRKREERDYWASV